MENEALWRKFPTLWRVLQRSGPPKSLNDTLYGGTEALPRGDVIVSSTITERLVAGAVSSGITRLDPDFARSIVLALGMAFSFFSLNAKAAESVQMELESRFSAGVGNVVAELVPNRDRFYSW